MDEITSFWPFVEKMKRSYWAIQGVNKKIKISSFVFVEVVVLKYDVSNMDNDGENEHLIN
jgi:hypothetical protein